MIVLLSILTAAVCERTWTRSEFQQPVTEPERAQLVEALAAMVERTYVDAEQGRRIASALRTNEAGGRYRRVAGTGALAKMLTQDMRSVVADAHLQVRARIVDAGSTRAEETPEAIQARRQRFQRGAAYDGYGIAAVEVLPGNIGYLKLHEFWSPLVAGEALTGAMSVIRDSDAIIFDLRDSYGGHEDVVTLLMGYFLRRTELLFTSVDRLAQETRHWRSAPYVPGLPRALISEDVPVYVLTSKRNTFSAAEMLSLALQRKRRAVIIGEQTKGGAHGGDFLPLSCRFDAFVPYYRTTIDGFSWEGVGVVPDLPVPEKRALDVAYRRALSALLDRPLPADADSLAQEIRKERREMLGRGLVNQR